MKITRRREAGGEEGVQSGYSWGICFGGETPAFERWLEKSESSVNGLSSL